MIRACFTAPLTASRPFPSTRDTLAIKWQQLSGIALPAMISAQEKQTFIKNFVGNRSFFSLSSPSEQFIQRLAALGHSTPSVKQRAALYEQFQTLAAQTLEKSPHHERMRQWANAISSEQQLEVFVQELLAHCHCIDELKPLATLSIQQKRHCLFALRDQSVYGQLRAAYTSVRAELPLIALTTALFPGLFALTHVARYLCFEMGELLGCDPHGFSKAAWIGPVIEELVFRTLLQTGVSSALSLLNIDEETQELIAVILTAIVFGLAHFYNPHDLIEHNLCHFINCTIGGIVLGFLYERYGFIASAASHTLFNTTLLTIASLISGALPMNERISLVALRHLRELSFNF